MANWTDYSENQLIDWYYRGQTRTAPTTRRFRLYTAAPGETGGGTEVSGGSYAAVSVTCNATNFAATQGGTSATSTGTGGQTNNVAAITFAAPTANWGTVTHTACDDGGANLLEYGTLTTARTINNGDAAPVFAAAAWTFTIA
ncbi:MAG: hypothetical protein ACK53T_17645 [Planctomycetota bacterium]|jgi:hypothetical protein